MSFIQKKASQLMLIFLLFTLINLCYTQTTTSIFRSSNIEIIPNFVIINSTSITNFICINHQINDLPLEVNFSKIIPSNEIILSTNILNKTTIDIKLETKNYVGIFHLLCYSSGEQNKGTRADIIVKAAPGVLQLAEKCRVFDRQYIKCVIRAPIIARAIQNDYPAKFEFNEISYSSDDLAYISRFEFLKNESTNEYLTFKWKPTKDGEFPNGVRMHMKAILPHFDESFYYFDMTPVFQIKPKFILQAISSSSIQINLTPITPAAFCEKNIYPKLISNVNQTWTVIESDRNTILVNNLLSNSIYRVCIKCRQIFTDPDGIEECQEVKTLNFIFNQTFIIIIIIVLIIFLFIGICFGIRFWRKRDRIKYTYVVDGNKPKTDFNFYSAGYSMESGKHIPINIQPPTPPSAPRCDNISDDNLSIEASDGEYLPIASIEDVIQMCSSPPILYSSEQ